MATRRNLIAVRENELRAAGQELGLSETRCFDYPDGGLPRTGRRHPFGARYRPDQRYRAHVVVTFGPDGFSGLPDHIAVGAVITKLGQS
ncbi:PIG-L family deacetylase [Mycobacterium gastri]|uniref:PIG-L deacetylase family protein n=1 Tax=Mycobacterium gastri TaxID=1777 RepID=UPI00142D7B9E